MTFPRSLTYRIVDNSIGSVAAREIVDNLVNLEALKITATAFPDFDFACVLGLPEDYKAASDTEMLMVYRELKKANFFVESGGTMGIPAAPAMAWPAFYCEIHAFLNHCGCLRSVTLADTLVFVSDTCRQAGSFCRQQRRRNVQFVRGVSLDTR